MSSHIHIDGSKGEGGGQVLRSSLTLSILTGKPFSISQIREGRQKPGLLRQHLTAVRAATDICTAETHGCEMNSSTLRFNPCTVKGGNYHFKVGTAGSTSLVLQTILLPLCFASHQSQVIIEGGTHNKHAPPYDFLHDCYLNVLRKMGANVDISLERPGYYPAGGGKIMARITPIESLQPIHLLERGAEISRQACARIAGLPYKIAERELDVAQKKFGFTCDQTSIEAESDIEGSGNVFFIKLGYENVCEVFTAFGERGVSAENVSATACKEAVRYEKAGVPVGDYLADQLLLPMAIAGGGSFRCTSLSQHFLTHVDIIQKFLNIKIHTQREARLAWKVTIQS